MMIGDHLRSVRHTLRATPLRTGLTLLGVIIGSGSIVFLAGLLHGGERALLSTAQGATDSDLVTVYRDDPPTKDWSRTRRELSRIDSEALATAPMLRGAPVASEASREVRAIYRDRKINARLVSGTPTTRSLYRLDLARGRFVSDDDMEERRRVCVVGFEIWRELLESAPDLDRVHVVAGGERWSVVGVLAHKPTLGGGDGTWMWDRKIVVPHTTFDAVFSPAHAVERLYVRAIGDAPLGDRLRVLRSSVRSVLLERHIGVENFRMSDADSAKRQERLILMVIKLLLLGTGLLALIVGGINIMNIMLVTVTERTREIGLRRAIGAPPRAILVQFLIEAALIALFGGVAGVVGGIALSWLAALALGKALGEWTFSVQAWSVVIALSLSLLTGVLFGLFPAWRAARLSPIEALRHE